MISEKEYDHHRRAAYHFFQRLEDYLNRQFLTPAELRRRVEKVVAHAEVSTDKCDKGKRSPEAAFVKSYVLPAVHDFLANWPSMNAEKARNAVRVEGYKYCLNLACGSPGRFVPHPFGKVLGKTASDIMSDWRQHGRKSFPAGSFPDMALGAPFKTVIECKYFRDGGTGRAESVLVEGLYEACFYLGLSRFPSGRRGVAWDYEFGCFLAGDVSEEGGLYKAWQSLSRSVRSGIWDGANTYAMVLRGQQPG
jgi:hypothetical protein